MRTHVCECTFARPMVVGMVGYCGGLMIHRSALGPQGRARASLRSPAVGVRCYKGTTAASTLADARARVPASSDERLRTDIMAALEAVNGLLAKLADDEDLADDLEQPQVKVAMRHWTAQERLPPEQAEKLMGDYRVMAVLTKIKALQAECQRAGIPVPLDAVLRRERALKLPGGGGGGDKAPQQAKQQPAAPKKKTTTTGKEEEGGQAKAAATAVADDASVSGPLVAAPSVSATTAVVAPRRSKRRPPQTLFEWLHLLSPLLTLVFGIVYALTRAVESGLGTKNGP